MRVRSIWLWSEGYRVYRSRGLQFRSGSGLSQTKTGRALGARPAEAGVNQPDAASEGDHGSNSLLNSCLRIFPCGLRGNKPGKNTIRTGTLKAARWAATKACNSCSVALVPGLSVTTAP